MNSLRLRITNYGKDYKQCFAPNFSISEKKKIPFFSARITIILYKEQLERKSYRKTYFCFI